LPGRGTETTTFFFIWQISANSDLATDFSLSRSDLEQEAAVESVDRKDPLDYAPFQKRTAVVVVGLR